MREPVKDKITKYYALSPEYKRRFLDYFIFLKEEPPAYEIIVVLPKRATEYSGFLVFKTKNRRVRDYLSDVPAPIFSPFDDFSSSLFYKYFKRTSYQEAVNLVGKKRYQRAFENWQSYFEDANDDW